MNATPDYTVLDNPGWSALTGPHAPLAIGGDRAKRYPSDMSPFAAIGDYDDPEAWAELAVLAGPGNGIGLAGRSSDLPAGWESVFSGTGLQMIGESVEGEPDDDAIDLTDADVPEMLELIGLTQPGPFEERTIDFGGYLGIREDGRLVAMAGQRLNPEGWIEISAVCTHPEYQHRGLAGRLSLAVAFDIREAGNIPFLHVRATNTNAIRVYERLGFTVRRETLFEQLRSPSH